MLANATQKIVPENCGDGANSAPILVLTSFPGLPPSPSSIDGQSLISPLFPYVSRFETLSGGLALSEIARRFARFWTPSGFPIGTKSTAYRPRTGRQQ
jgi:hypothetical protein